MKTSSYVKSPVFAPKAARKLLHRKMHGYGLVEEQKSKLQVRSILNFSQPQAKLEIGKSDDAYEKEADFIADTVMCSPSSTLEAGDNDSEEEKEEELVKKEQHEPQASLLRLVIVQRQSEDVDIDIPQQTSTDALPAQIQSDYPDETSITEDESEPWPEPSVEELAEFQNIQRKSINDDETQVEDNGIVERIQHPAAGRPLSSAIQQRIETHLPYDYSSVRIHDSPQDRQDSRAINARAFTYGNHIWLGKNESSSDVRLMAHELTHVAQQGAVQRKRIEKMSLNKSSKKIRRGLLDSIANVTSAATDWLLAPVREQANNIPGYTLLTVILGRDPITDQRVERTATNIVRGVVGLIPGGEQMYNNLQQSNAIQSAYQWFQLEIDKLNISWDLVKGLFMRTWDSLSLSDLASPASAFRRIRDIFTPTLQRIVRFSVACGQKILQFIFEGALRIAGPAGEQVLGVLRRAGDTINLIFSDPVAFGRNLINAVVQGFVQFKDNILSHLRTALLGWMFGTLAQAGIQMPETFDLKGLLSIALQILGLTYANLRRKLVRVIGERRVAFIETAVEFLTVIVRDGLMAAWQKILEYLGNLRDMVITAVRDWVVTRIVVAAVSRLATMFNPAGAIIQAVIAVYNTVMFLIERAQQIVAVVDSVFSSIGAIARGSISQAANFVEQTMGRVLPVIISFLARLIGLGGIANTIKGFIQNIQQRVDRVLTRVVNFIVQRARRLMSGARQAVGRIVQWWRTRKTFTAAGEEHALYFEGDENNAQLMINSTPQTVEHFLANANPSPSNHQAMESYNQARNLLRTVNNEIQAARRQRRQDAPAATEGAMETNLEQLKVKLQEHMSSMGGSVDIPPTHRTFGRLEHGELGTSMTARPLSIRAPENDGHPAGGPPAASPPIWDAVRHRYAGGRTYYIRGHLLNEQLHGPGIAENLSPITQDANREHENLAERRVKDQAWGRHDRDSGEGQNQQGLAVEYSVRAVYGHHARSNTQALKSEVANLALADEQRARMNAILDNEEKLPTKFVCDAWLLNISAQNDFQRAQKFVDNIEITNTIPNTIPQLSEGGTPRRLTSMSTASADELGRISSVSLTASDIQYILSAQVSLNRNIRYFDQLKRSEQNPAGLTEEKINILINDSSIRVRPLNPV